MSGGEPRPFWPWFVIGVAGSVAGFWVGGERFKGRAETTRFTAAAAPQDERIPALISALEDLVEVLAERELASAPRASVESWAEASGAGAPLDAEQLLAQLERIAVQLERGASGASRSAVRVPRMGDRSGVAQGSAARAELAKGDEGYLAHGILMDHLLWTQEEILSAYGNPDEAFVQDYGARWQYEDMLEDDDVSFAFINGRVQAVY